MTMACDNTINKQQSSHVGNDPWALSVTGFHVATALRMSYLCYRSPVEAELIMPLTCHSFAFLISYLCLSIVVYCCAPVLLS